MTIKGTVYEIIFRNEDNGYTIAVIDVDGHPVTAVGTFPPVTEGHFVTLIGDYVNHSRYGRQFKADSVRLDKPDTLHGMTMFLGSGLIRGIGPAKAAAIVQHFGKDTFEVIEKNPQALAKVRGISKNLAAQIADSYGEVQIAADALTFLMDYDISANLAMRIFNVYGANTVAAVTTNPYSLIENVSGIGFIVADRIAGKIGIDRNSEFRLRAGVVYALSDASEKGGNTCLPVTDVASEAMRLLDVSDADRIDGIITQLLLDRRIKAVDCEGTDGIMLMAYYVAESKSADKILRILEYNNRVFADRTKDIERFERMHGMSFHDMQKQAINTSLTSGVSVITGGPGTGKTTIIKCIISILLEAGKSVRLMAPTGRAAKRLGEATGQPASTIHRALMSEGEMFADTIIIDEFSMVDAQLLYRIAEEISDETKLIIVGDSDQLPSVGAGNVLADIIGSGVVPVTRLTQIFRQEECSKIILNAHKVNSGIVPDLANGDTDFFFIRADGQYEMAEKVVELVKTRLPKYLDCEPKNIQVLSPMKAGEAGCISLNKRLRAALIPKSEELLVGENAFSVGDKVMHTVNNYNLSWRKDASVGKGVFNGDLGYVVAIRKESGEMDVEFEDGRLATYAGDDKSQLMLAYAITVHKSQGSEYEGVVVVVSGSHSAIMTRNLLYTAITRAKGLVVLLGSEQAIKRMVDNNYIQKRYSQLNNMLVAAQRKSKLLFSGQTN